MAMMMRHQPSHVGVADVGVPDGDDDMTSAVSC